MADLVFAPQHNMIAYLEKTKSNVEFHQIVDFLTSSSIHHSLTIHAIVDGKTAVITKSSVRRDLIFTNANGITCLTNEQIFKNLLLMGGDSLVRGATTASLDAPHDSSNITKTQSKVTLNEPTSQRECSSSGLGRQETMGGAMAHIRSEGALIQSIDPPLSTGYTVGSEEDMMEHEIELIDPVLDLENVKSVQEKEIASFKKKVTKLEQRQSSRFLGFYLFSDGTSKRHILGKRKVSKQERKNLKLQQMFQDIDDVLDEDADTEMIVEDKGNCEKGGSTAETVSTARSDISAARPEVSTIEPKTPPTTATLFDDEDVTIADTLVKMKNQKAKEKGIAFKDADDSTRPIRSIATF
nr:hypothetical protein [Tanacetum cinerariifolium]